MFKPWRWMYRPALVAGWVITVLVLAFGARILLWVDMRSHSVSNILCGVFRSLCRPPPPSTCWRCARLVIGCESCLPPVLERPLFVFGLTYGSPRQ